MTAYETTMKILLDQMSDGWYDRLRYLGHDVYSVTRLRSQGHSLQDDPSVGAYAKENDMRHDPQLRITSMVLVTLDGKFAKYCKAVDIPHINIDNDDLFKILRQKLDEYGDIAKG